MLSIRDSRSGKFGFSLLELMIVLAVIATLALMAMPSYFDRIVRDQIVEALPLADVAKGPIAGAWSTGRDFPVDNKSAELPDADKIVSNYVKSVSVHPAAIDITFGNGAHASIKNKVLTVRAAVVSDSRVVPVTWVCGYATVPDKMTAYGLNNTTVPRELLPFKCRR